MTMLPLATAPERDLARVDAVLTDIDDTLTLHGRLPAEAFEALERLQRAGIRVIPITGRPAGWCDMIARQWPVDGVVGENGAFYFRYDEATHSLTGEDSETIYSSGMRLKLRLAEANPVNGALRFELPEGRGALPPKRPPRVIKRRGRPANIRHQGRKR